MASNQKQNLPNRPPQSGLIMLEDIKRIASLPRQKLRIGGVIREVVIDPVTKYIYFPNPNPKSDHDLLQDNRVPWSERMGKIEEVAAVTKNTANNQEALPEKTSKNKDSKKTEKKQKSKKKFVAAALIAVIVIGGGTVFAPGLIQNLLTNTQEQPKQDDTADVQVGETSSIVQVLRPLIPGDVITDEDIQEAIISTETYNQITLQGTNLYLWQRHETLVGMYVQEYIPAGQYVSFASVGAAYDPPQTLWKPDSYIDIPLTEEQNNAHLYQPGEKVKIVIRTETVTETPSTDKNTKTELSGGGAVTTIQQQSSINETQIPSTTVCDVLTGADGKGSMFQTLSELSAVPAGEQADYIRNAAKQEGFFDKFNQKYLRVYVSAEDAKAIGDISNPEKTTIVVESTGEYSKENDTRATFVSNAQATLKNVQAVIDLVFGEENNQ